MNTAQKIRLISMCMVVTGFTWALSEVGMFSKAAFQQSPQLTFVYILLYTGIVGVFLSMLWKN